MPKWTEYKAIARERGALALELYACVSEPAGTPEAVRDALAQHLAYQGDLEKAGKLAMAGPMSDLSGDMMEGVGLIIYRASSLADAMALANADPMHKSGARRFTLRRWLVNEGNLTVTVGLSTGTTALQ